MALHSGERNIKRRLLKNKGALVGMLIILIACVIAVFAYFISPDGSPNANRMIVEIGGNKPGFKQQFLKIPSDDAGLRPSFLYRLMYGEKDRFDYLPIQGYQWRDDSVIVQRF